MEIRLNAFHCIKVKYIFTEQVTSMNIPCYYFILKYSHNCYSCIKVMIFLDNLNTDNVIPILKII
jgi:hypothetical protein